MSSKVKRVHLLVDSDALALKSMKSIGTFRTPTRFQIADTLSTYHISPQYEVDSMEFQFSMIRKLIVILELTLKK